MLERGPWSQLQFSQQNTYFQTSALKDELTQQLEEDSIYILVAMRGGSIFMPGHIGMVCHVT